MSNTEQEDKITKLHKEWAENADIMRNWGNEYVRDAFLEYKASLTLPTHIN